MKMKKIFFISIFILSFFCKSLAQQVAIEGTIIDSNGIPVEGALVSDLSNQSVYTFSDEKGGFYLSDLEVKSIKISWKGVYEKNIVIPENGKIGTVVLDNLTTFIDLGKRKTTRELSTQAVTTIKAEEINNNSSFTLQDALWGISPTGIRGDKYEKLLVVDGYPRSWEYLSKQSVESISILKDAAAKALWGARGANGVIVVTTKRGNYKSKEVDIEYTHGGGIPSYLPEMANATTYARAVNEALYYDGLSPRYTNDEIGYFASADSDKDIYPNTDWMGEALRDNTSNNQLNINVRGGMENIRYFSSTNYKNNLGILNPKYATIGDRYSSQIRSYKLSSLMNLDFNFTNSTFVKLNLLALLSENINPRMTNAEIFGSLVEIPSAAFPVKTENNLWGGDLIYQRNPIADFSDRGFNKLNQRMLQADITLTQNLNSVLPGLKAEISIAYDNSVTYSESQAKDYIYEVNQLSWGQKESVEYGEESNLAYSSSLNDQFMQTGLRFNLLYENTFTNGHILHSSATYNQESLVGLGRNNTWKRQYVMGTLGYNIHNRYIVDLVVNYYGTSVLPKGERFTLYPALSGGWIISNEESFNNEKIKFLKLRLSVGQSGLDNLPYELDRQFWEYGGTYYFRDANTAASGIMEGALAAINIKNERATESNIGIDLQLGNRMSINADAFYKRKDNIRVSGAATYSSVLGIEVPNVFEGINDTKGGELSITWQEKQQNSSYYIQGNLTYARTKVIENNEGYQPYDYLYKKGYPFGQFFGLEAVGYFNDFNEIENSPRQMFSDVRPGDIKYKDQNNDGIIDNYDIIANGYSTYLPEIFFGLKLGFSYKNIGLDMILQGVTNYSIILNTPSVYWPLRNNTNISEWYLTDRIRWTEETKNSANLPRLTTLDNSNNFRNSTQWLEDGSYLSLKNINLYYNIPISDIRVFGLQEAQIYLRGNNLLMFDKVKYLTSENLSVGYPNLKSIYMGVRVKF